jgi:hypothetical protein
VDCGNVNLWRAVRAARVVRGFVSSIQLRLAVAVVCQGSRRSWDLRMKPRQLELLRKIAEAPRTLHQMTMHRRITAPTIARIGWVRRAGR